MVRECTQLGGTVSDTNRSAIQLAYSALPSQVRRVRQTAPHPLGSWYTHAAQPQSTATAVDATVAESGCQGITLQYSYNGATNENMEIDKARFDTFWYPTKTTSLAQAYAMSKATPGGMGAILGDKG